METLLNAYADVRTEGEEVTEAVFKRRQWIAMARIFPRGKGPETAGGSPGWFPSRAFY